MNAIISALLRVMLVLIALVLLVGQVVAIPAIATEMARQAPYISSVRVPYEIAGITALGCAQVVLVATWVTASEVQAGRWRSSTVLRCLDVTVCAAVLALILILGVSYNALVVYQLQVAPVTVALAVAALFTATSALLTMLASLAIRSKRVREARGFSEQHPVPTA